jgi:hypothetical protein
LGGSQASRKKAEIENYLKIREGQLWKQGYFL